MPNWSHEQEFKLLLNIINQTNPKPPNWHDIASAMGNGFTKEACRQHFQKIKRETKGSASAPSTPSKKSTPSTPSSKSAKRKQFANGDSENVDDDATGPRVVDLDDSPSAKKMKKDPGFEQTGLQFKAEDPDGSVVDLEDQSLYV